MTTQSTPAAPNAPAAPAAQAPATAEAPATPEIDESFEAVFDRITSGDEGDKSAAEPKAVEGAPASAAVDEGAAPAGETPAATASADAGATAAPPATPATSDPVAERDATIKRLEAELAAAKKPPEPAKPAAEAAPPAAADDKPADEGPKWYEFPKEEQEVIDKFKTDWPESAQAIELHTKAAVYNGIQFVFDQIKRNYGPVIARFGELSDTIETRLALTDIEREHSDYDKVYDKVVEWVKTLPVFARMGAEQVMKEGTPQEVNELIAEYKKLHPAAATATAAAGAPAPAQATPAVRTDVSPAAKKAAQKLTVVDSKRTVPTAEPDANDFDAAWKEATATDR